MFVPTVAVAANSDGVRSHREVRRTRRTFAELVGDQGGSIRDFTSTGEIGVSSSLRTNTERYRKHASSRTACWKKAG